MMGVDETQGLENTGKTGMNSKDISPTKSRRLKDVHQWDKTTEVAVVGYGAAGACAAMTAKEAGTDVTIFELASAGGGSTALSSAEIYMGGNGGTRVQRACGYHDATEDMFNYLKMCAGEQGDEAKIRAYCEGSVDHFNWLVERGVPFQDSELKERAIVALTDDGLLYTGNEQAWPFDQIAKPAPRGHNLYVEGDNGGPLFMKIMMENVERMGIPVEYDARALTLIQDDQGTVQGVVVRQDMQEMNVRARKGVILCAGGFVMNQDMLKRYAPLLTRCNAPTGNPGDDGAGILMGMGAGGAAINMHEGLTTLPFYPPASLTFGIMVNASGQRFINEDCYHGRVGNFCLRQPENPIYLIFNADDFGDYQESSCLSADIAGTGDSIENLEKELLLPRRALQQTMEFYNDGAVRGEDPKFHKNAKWLKPIEGPYAALDCTPGRGAMYAMFTLGGLDTLPTGEVLTGERNPVKGLYAAGRTTAGVPRRSDGYASGISVGDATFFGRMAGETAAAAEPVDGRRP